MSLNLNDLPPALRKQVDAKLGTSKRKRTTQRTGPATGFHGWCFRCGVVFSTQASWERHADETGHARLELIAPWPGDAA